MYIHVNSLISGKVYKLTFNNPCFANYRIREGIYGNGNCLNYNYSTMPAPTDKKTKEYKFVFLAIETTSYFYDKNYDKSDYTILKILFDGKIAYSFINNMDKSAIVYE